MLRGKQWRRESHGLYVPADSVADLRGRCGALLHVLPARAVFCGPTAVLLRGCRTPSFPDLLPVFVAVPPDGGDVRRAGVRQRRTAVSFAEVEDLGGLPVTSVRRTIADLPVWLGLVDLLIVIDGLLYNGDMRADELTPLASRRRVRGVQTLRRALPLADGASESAYETILRLLHVLSGVAVESQVNIFDEDGSWLARADLVIRGTRRLVEYDGATHRERVRHESDLARDKRLMRAGYVRYGYTAAELFGSPERIVADAVSAGGRPTDVVVDSRQRFADGIAGDWRKEYCQSLFFGPQRHRFAERWCRPSRCRAVDELGGSAVRP